MEFQPLLNSLKGTGCSIFNIFPNENPKNQKIMIIPVTMHPRSLNGKRTAEVYGGNGSCPHWREHMITMVHCLTEDSGDFEGHNFTNG